MVPSQAAGPQLALLPRWVGSSMRSVTISHFPHRRAAHWAQPPDKTAFIALSSLNDSF